MRSLISAQAQIRAPEEPTFTDCSKFETDLTAITQVTASTPICFKTQYSFYVHSTGKLNLEGKNSTGYEFHSKDNVFGATCQDFAGTKDQQYCYYKLTTKSDTDVKFYPFKLNDGSGISNNERIIEYYETHIVAKEEYHLNIPINYYSEDGYIQKQIIELQVVNPNGVNISVGNGNKLPQNMIIYINDEQKSEVDNVESARVKIDFRKAGSTYTDYQLKFDVSAVSNKIPVPNQAFRLNEYKIFSKDEDNWREYRGLDEHPDPPEDRDKNTPLIVGLTSFFVVAILVTAFVLHYCVCPKYNPGDQEDTGSSSSSSSSSSS